MLLCGGSGTRLWPLSRQSYPKQFAKLTGETRLYQASAQRFSGEGYAPPTIVTAADFRFIVIEQLAQLEICPADVLIEPSPKNTPAAICTAALALEAKVPGALMLVAPSDRVIPDAESFNAVIQAAKASALRGQIVTFGILPTRPETGYGWLELDAVSKNTSTTPLPVQRFIEELDLKNAEVLLSSHKYLWNAGIFLSTTTSMLDAFKLHAPEVLRACEAASDTAEHDLSLTRLAPEPWSQVPDISIDYAVMERASNLTVMPYEGAWSDFGEWQAVWRAGKADETGTVTSGSAWAVACEDTLLKATNEAQVLVGMGLKDIVAVAMSDAVLVAHKDHAQNVKSVVHTLASFDKPQAKKLPSDHHPWGHY